jgi:hypothetical protein
MGSCEIYSGETEMEYWEHTYATVSCAASPQACHVRCKIGRPGDIPVSIKAGFKSTDRPLLTEGTLVVVGRTDPVDATKYRVVRIVQETWESTPYPHQEGKTEVPAKPAAAAQPRLIRFFMAPKYFQPHDTQSGMRREVAVRIFARAFGMPDQDVLTYMRSHSEGFFVHCRPGQFAGFIVLRHKEGKCINGIRDLDPAYLGHHRPVTTTTLYARAVELFTIAKLGASNDNPLTFIEHRDGQRVRDILTELGIRDSVLSLPGALDVAENYSPDDDIEYALWGRPL